MILLLATGYSRAAHDAAVVAGTPAPQLNGLMMFGFFSAVFTLVSLAHVHQFRNARLLLALSLTAQSGFGFLFGIWPLGLVALVLAGLAARWWWRQNPRVVRRVAQRTRAARSAAYVNALSESRLSIMFRSTSGEDSAEDD